MEKVKTMTETCMGILGAVILLSSQFIQYFYAVWVADCVL